ncbi:hypothetical protein X772_34845 [Mesorhizobium sp. LSJC280B00]|nr:hypothetical protein X772_34845 [Mesorhizobium sp. LSJC280B00]
MAFQPIETILRVMQLSMRGKRLSCHAARLGFMRTASSIEIPSHW